MGAQLLAQAEGQVQEAAVDGPDLESEARTCCSLAAFVACRRRRGAELRRGVTGHAVNWHAEESLKSLRGCSVCEGRCDAPQNIKLCQSSSRRLCRRIP